MFLLPPRSLHGRMHAQSSFPSCNHQNRLFNHEIIISIKSVTDGGNAVVQMACLASE